MEDSNIKYLILPHKLLMGLVGLPMGLFVTFGFPVFVFCMLQHRRKQLHQEKVVSRYEFFYQGYEIRCAYWEVAIYLRKSIIAVLTTTSHALQPILQASLSLGTLLVYLAAQVHYEPYKESKLDKMDEASLFVSISVYILGGMVQCSNSKLVKFTLSIIMIIMLLSFVAYMLYEISIACWRTWQEWLRSQEEYDEHTGGFRSICRVTARVVSSQSRSKVTEVKTRLRSLINFPLQLQSQPNQRTAGADSLDAEGSSAAHLG